MSYKGIYIYMVIKKISKQAITNIYNLKERKQYKKGQKTLKNIKRKKKTERILIETSKIDLYI